MNQSADVVIVGAGVMGASTARALARRGARVLLLEQFEIGHTRGSSHGGSRIIRYTHPTADYAAMMPAIFDLWRDVQDEAGEELLRLCGGLYVATAGDEFLRACRETLSRLAMPFEILSADDMARRYPHFRLSAGDEVLFQEQSGILAASPAVAALVRLAQRDGVTLRTNSRVTGVTPTSGGAHVTWEQEGNSHTVAAHRVIITAGPWAKQILQPLLPEQLPLRVTHQQVGYFRVHDPSLWTPQRCPIYIFTADPHVYGFPIHEKPGLIKVARELFEQEVDPDGARSVLQHAAGELQQVIAARFVGVDPEPVQIDTCLYTETPTRDFVIDRHPEFPQIIMGVGFSGRGFKFGVGMGELLAHLATTPPGDYYHPFWLDKFAMGRFATVAQTPPPSDLFRRRDD